MKGDAQQQGVCRLCLEEDAVSDLVSCCGCTGSIKYIHSGCLRKWQQTLCAQGQYKRASYCELCCQCHQQSLQLGPATPAPLWLRLKLYFLQLQNSPEVAFKAWRCCILLGGLAAGTQHGVSGLGRGINLGVRLARPLAALTLRLMPQFSVAAAMLPSLTPMLCSALRCSCCVMLLEVGLAAAAGLFGGGVVGFCLGTVGVVRLSASMGCQAAGVAARVAAALSQAAWPRALALVLLKGSRHLNLHRVLSARVAAGAAAAH